MRMTVANGIVRISGAIDIDYLLIADTVVIGI